MSKKNLQEEGVLTADGFSEAILGIARRCGKPAIVAYDVDECIRILQRDSDMSKEEAWEYFSFNVVGSWMGEMTPIFVYKRDPLLEEVRVTH